jgi:hypothetical protein
LKIFISIGPWPCITFLKKILTRMRYMMKEKPKLIINVT